MGDLTKNLSRKEFACKCDCHADHVELLLVSIVQAGRNEFGKVIITSGVRCVSHNIAVGGGTNSKHLTGEAADIHFERGNPTEWTDWYDLMFGRWIAIGTYGMYIHVDVRGYPVRWTV